MSADGLSTDDADVSSISDDSSLSFDSSATLESSDDASSLTVGSDETLYFSSEGLLLSLLPQAVTDNSIAAVQRMAIILLIFIEISP